MAYEYKKINEVTLVETATDHNVLIEEGGEIKRIPASNISIPQVKSDWNETDATSPAFILNKPDLSNVGSGGGSAVHYVLSGTTLTCDMVNVSRDALLQSYKDGNTIWIKKFNAVNNTEGLLVGISYTLSEDTLTGLNIYYVDGTSIASQSL